MFESESGRNDRTKRIRRIETFIVKKRLRSSKKIQSGGIISEKLKIKELSERNIETVTKTFVIINDPIMRKNGRGRFERRRRRRGEFKQRRARRKKEKKLMMKLIGRKGRRGS